MTPSWSRLADITFDHWGYRVRLEESHIVLAILFTQLLVLPSEREYKRLYGRDLDWVNQDREARMGEPICEWQVLRHLFAVVAGELLREDEVRGLRIRRDLGAFRYRLRGEQLWKSVDEKPEVWG
jgi:hypothetical protein